LRVIAFLCDLVKLFFAYSALKQFDICCACVNNQHPV